MKREITAGLYRHFKGNMYRVLFIAKHTETGEDMVVYRAEYGDHQLYVRPYDMFASEVDRDKYPNAEQKYRFEPVEEDENSHEIRKTGMLYNGKEIVQCGCCKLSFTMDDENCIKNIFGDKVVCCPECHSTYSLSDVH